MRIVGHGIDIIETDRIRHMVDRYGSRFLDRCFRPQELAYSMNRARGVEHLAGRFAAKEAVFKVLGTGWGHGTAWMDAEVRRLPSGAPEVVLHGPCRQIAASLGIDSWLLSISHIRSVATASAIGVAQR